MRPNWNPALVGAFVVAFSSFAAADPPSNWTTLTLPPNQISIPNSIGTTVTFMTTTDAWLYSGITKEWTVLPVSNPSPIFQANDYCIIQDGNLIHGFASHTGKVDTITTSGSATMVSGPASSSWVTLVADGTTLYGFGGFHGKWESVTLSQPNPTLVANRLIGLALDGSTVWGLSAHHGTFVPVAADLAALLTVVGEGEAATASSPGVFRGFSAQQNTWATQAVPVGALSFQKNEYAMLWSGNQAWGYSGLTGTMASHTASAPIVNIDGAEGVAGFVDGTDVVCYSSGRGQFVSRPAVAPSFYFDYHFAFVFESGSVTPFSALTGQYGATLPGTYSVTANDAVAYLDSATGDYAYSPVLNTFAVAPLSNPTSVSCVRDSVVLGHSSGYEAYSARHGTWVSLATSLIGSFQAPTSGATFAAIDGVGETVHVFDARLNRWATVSGQGPLTIKISRHTIMAHDGTTGFGFGQPSGEWYSVPLTQAPSKFDTASSIGALTHGSELSVYSVQGSFAYTGRYPEFTQAINLGNTLRLHQVAPPGSNLLLLLGVQPAYIDMGTTLGHLYIDPSFFVVIPWPVAVDGDGILDMDIAMPNNPIIIGLQPQLQNYVIPPAGADPWLSSSVAPVLF
ncbi:MAG: hypothetical protein IPH13_02370 [Planctomycetes bacterium]|nr:hypothetical protein [Planctomycetota bacterium]